MIQKCANGLPIPSSIEAAKAMEEVSVGTRPRISYEKEMTRAGEKGLYLNMSQAQIGPIGEYHPKRDIITLR